MDFKLIIAIILSFLPISELRGGLPFAIVYSNQHNIPISFVFLLVLLVNILAIFFVFYFLDNVHDYLMKNLTFYKKFFDSYLKKIRIKADKLEKKYSTLGFLALTIFVAIPLPGTGAWTGSIISWLLKLDRKKSILSISLGVIIAGFSVLLGTLGVLNSFFGIL